MNWFERPQNGHHRWNEPKAVDGADGVPFDGTGTVRQRCNLSFSPLGGAIIYHLFLRLSTILMFHKNRFKNRIDIFFFINSELSLEKKSSSREVSSLKQITKSITEMNRFNCDVTNWRRGGGNVKTSKRRNIRRKPETKWRSKNLMPCLFLSLSPSLLFFSINFIFFVFMISLSFSFFFFFLWLLKMIAVQRKNAKE